MIGRVSIALCALAISMAPVSHAHDFGELAPLNPEIRNVLITLLEDAGDEDKIDGDPIALSTAGSDLAARLIVVIDTMDAADRVWLQTVEHKALEHPLYGRVPLGTLIQLFHDLAHDMSHAHTEFADEKDAAFRADLRRLDTLSKSVWGK